MTLLKSLKAQPILQLKACIKYRDFLLSLNIKSIDNIGNFEEKQFIEKISHKFLAK